MRAIFVFLTLSLSFRLLAEDPGDFAKRVCEGNKSSGIPEGAAAKFFSGELQALFLTANEIDARFKVRFPDEKPPFAEFDVIKPSPDAPTRFRVIDSSATDPKLPRPVIVEFSYSEDGNVICDFAVLYLAGKGSGSWEISDVAYVTSRSGGAVLSLVEALRKGIAENDE